MNMHLMNNTIHKAIDEAMEEVARKFGMTFVKGTLRYTDTDCRLEVRLITITEGKDETSDNMVRMGYARPGTKIMVGKYGPGTVLKAVRRKYTVKLDSGKEGSVPFNACTAMPTK